VVATIETPDANRRMPSLKSLRKSIYPVSFGTLPATRPHARNYTRVDRTNAFRIGPLSCFVPRRVARLQAWDDILRVPAKNDAAK
jgi:hypothetical protein